MRGQGRPGADRWLQSAVCAVVALVTLRAAAAQDNLAAMRADAQLTDVAFVDAEHGWAVGDRGAIWATDDGEHWRLQESGVECRLAAVQFLDAKNGFAAGGWTEPYTGACHGVLLVTRDGGQHWSHDRKTTLPALRAIRFFDRNRGWALGAPSPLFPSSVFTTDDGGRAWTPLAATDGVVWTTGDFADPLSGALAGPNGALAIVRRRGVERSRFSDESLRHWRRLRASGAGPLWAVGDGAWIMQSGDLGQSWRPPTGTLDPAYRDQFDLHAIAARDARCWIAGAPGTRVFHSPDAGRSWILQATGVTTPIRGLAFVDDEHGWAVGDLGVILGTGDGGRSWRRQRSPAARAALWGCFSAARQIPLELLARLAADEGYFSVVDVVGRRDLDGAAASPDAAARLHEAVVAAGGSAGEMSWRFPLRQAELRLSQSQTVDGWNRAHDGRGLEQFESLLVARIRQWRPSLIVTAGSTTDAAQQLIADSLAQAIERAADPTWFTDQVTLAGLAPWRAQRVVVALPPGELGPLVVTSANVSARLGHSYADLAAPARSLIDGGPTPNVIGFRLASAGVTGARGGDGRPGAIDPGGELAPLPIDPAPPRAGDPQRHDFFTGIPLSPGGEARRSLPDVALRNLEAMKRSAQTRRNLDSLFARADAGGNDAGWLGGAADVLRNVEPAAAAASLDRLAERYHHRGEWQSAAEARELLVARYPNEPLAAAALAWLVQYYASGEAQHRARRSQGQVADQLAGGETAGARTAPNAPGGSGVRPAAAIEPVDPARAEVRDSAAAALIGQRPDAWPAKAAELGKQLEQLSASAGSEPAVRFPLAVAYREQGFSKQADRYYLAVARTRSHDAWWACAAGEAWLAAPRSATPEKSVWPCRRAIGRPKLDGRLDDPTWKAAASIELRSAQRDDAEWPAVVMAAYDEEFLYFSVSCRMRPGAAPAAEPSPAGQAPDRNAPRPRDADLTSRDRSELLIDVDRDWTTWYRLAVDHRGWTRDECWGDASWNPRWYVAHDESEGAWSCEAAIPLADLTGVRPGPRSVWAVGVQRIAPGVGFQSWTRPASVAGRGEGFGYLIFE